MKFAALRKAMIPKTAIPKGYSTVAQVAVELGVSKPRAQGILMGMYTAKRVDRQRVKLCNENGSMAWGYVYKVIK